jgi:hypothetical protein
VQPHKKDRKLHSAGDGRKSIGFLKLKLLAAIFTVGRFLLTGNHPNLGFGFDFSIFAILGIGADQHFYRNFVHLTANGRF